MSSSRPIIPLPSRATSAGQGQRLHLEQSERRTLATKVYQQTWTEFYRWKIEESGRLMAELMVMHPDVYEKANTDDHVIEDDQDEEAFRSSDLRYDRSGFLSASPGISSHGAVHLDEEMAFLSFRDSNVGPGSEVFTFTTYHEESRDPADSSYFGLEIRETQSRSAFTKPAGSAIDRTAKSSAAGGIDSTFLPHPRYYFCTPSSRNLIQTDDHLRFSLFEDDPGFDLDSYLKSFQSFAWQVDFIDPDIEMIQLETVRRLRHAHGFSFESIDSLRLFVTIRKSPCSGLIWDTSQRDLLRWPGMQLSELPELSINDLQSVPLHGDIFAHVKNGGKTFCPSLNCVCSFCGVHRNTISPDLCPVKPTLKAENLRLKKGNSCGHYCFRLLDLSDEVAMEAVHWENEADVELLRGILQITPDVLPCDLAVILQERCQDIFVYRTRLLPDENIEENVEEEELNELRQLSVFEDEPKEDIIASADFFPLPPCNHKGPCSRDSGCPCFLEKHHCQRNCQCSRKCPIRWKGCHCNPEGSRKKACSTYKGCPCRAVGRECDPELCTRCDARRKKHKHQVCTNIDSQWSQYPLIEIKRGSFGLGAFTTSALQYGQPIGEYTGEILSKDTEIHSSQISDFIKLNYKYDLNKAAVLDSMYVGNEMRYLNHESPTSLEEISNSFKNKGPNCIGKVIYALNDHKIILYTSCRIEAGSELLLDYGELYWRKEEISDSIYWR